MAPDISFKSITNKSRDGFYWVKKYQDKSGKHYTATIEAGRLSFKEFEKYVDILSVSELKGKAKAEFSRNYYKAVNAPAEVKKEKIAKKEAKMEQKDQEMPPEPKKNYNLEREKSLNALIKDRNAIMDLGEYEGKETRIIFSLGNKASLSTLSEDQFRAKLIKYMPSPKTSQAQKFLDDIINKWGSEIKDGD
jgi:hypothetical protein